MRKITIYIFGCLCLLTACVKPDEKAATSLEEPWIDSTLTEDLVRDKALGYLVGSAIGDAHGAPTEMWYRGDILSRFGYVDSLDAVIREASAEGPWKTNLPAGGTTDDTRWRLLLNRFLLAQARTLKDLSAQAFARHILNEYEMQAAALAQLDTLPADHYLTQEMKVHFPSQSSLRDETFLPLDPWTEVRGHLHCLAPRGQTTAPCQPPKMAGNLNYQWCHAQISVLLRSPGRLVFALLRKWGARSKADRVATVERLRTFFRGHLVASAATVPPCER